jgi:hypothetical protein
MREEIEKAELSGRTMYIVSRSEGWDKKTVGYYETEGRCPLIEAKAFFEIKELYEPLSESMCQTKHSRKPMRIILKALGIELDGHKMNLSRFYPSSRLVHALRYGTLASRCQHMSQRVTPEGIEAQFEAAGKIGRNDLTDSEKAELKRCMESFPGADPDEVLKEAKALALEDARQDALLSCRIAARKEGKAKGGPDKI